MAWIAGGRIVRDKGHGHGDPNVEKKTLQGLTQSLDRNVD